MGLQATIGSLKKGQRGRGLLKAPWPGVKEKEKEREVAQKVRQERRIVALVYCTSGSPRVSKMSEGLSCSSSLPACKNVLISSNEEPPQRDLPVRARLILPADLKLVSHGGAKPCDSRGH